jgi:dihydropteroate synthase
VQEVKVFLDGAIQQAEAADVAPDSILIDPGIGFGKTVEHNLQLLNRLCAFASLRKPILTGTSRKTFIGKVLDLAPEDRLYGSVAAVAASVLRGAHVVRVHDTREMIQAARMTDAVVNETLSAPSRSARAEVAE